MKILIIISIVVFIILLFIWVIYNQLVKAKNIVDEAYSGIDVQLKKRFELIPNLIEALKGYNAHEANTLMKIVETRSASGKTINEMKSNDASVTNDLKSFRVSVEAYPDLKANTQFLVLMQNLSTVENELSMARRYYNGATRDLNIKMGVFPSVIIAPALGFKKASFYEIEEEQKVVPTIELNS